MQLERMATTTKTQRRRARRKPVDSSAICIKLKDGMGRLSRITADVVDVIDGGFGVNLPTPLQPGSLVLVGDHVEAEVRWCVQKSDGTFRAGLQNSRLDCYEILQLFPTRMERPFRGCIDCSLRGIILTIVKPATAKNSYGFPRRIRS